MFDEYPRVEPQLNSIIPNNLGVWRCGRNDGKYKKPTQELDPSYGFNWILDFDELMYFKDIYLNNLNSQKEVCDTYNCQKYFYASNKEDVRNLLKNLIAIRVFLYAKSTGAYTFADILAKFEICVAPQKL